MFFNLFGKRKDNSSSEIDKKCKISVNSSYSDNTKLDCESEDEIHIVLGDKIKKSRFTSEFHDQSNHQ